MREYIKNNSSTHKLREEKIVESEFKCQVPGCQNPGFEMNHVFGGRGRRKQTESSEMVVMLCSEHHRGGNYQKWINYFRIKVSAELIEKYGEDEARKIAGGRLYFEEDSDENS